MKTFIAIAFIALSCCSALAATPGKGSTACTAAQNPWGTTRCANANCYPYVKDPSATPQVNAGGFTCTTPVGSYFVFNSITNQDTTGATSDSVCQPSCAAAATGDTTAPCDSTGTLCSSCATNYAASGKAPTAASQQPCDCVVATTADKTQTCPACAHGYYGTDSTNAAVTPSSVSGSTDSTYTLQYSGTLPNKCVVCPTLSNCAQCASATVCAKCTAASGNTPSSSGSCSASKILASAAFVFVGLVALIF